MDLVDRIISERRSLHTDPEFLSCMAENRTEHVKNDMSGDPKYRLMERPEYLEDGRRVARCGADLSNLYTIILLLWHGCIPSRDFELHDMGSDVDGIGVHHAEKVRRLAPCLPV